MARDAPGRTLSWLSGDPLDLAIFRIAVAAVWLLSADVWRAPEAAAHLAEMPPSVWTVPWGVGWLVGDDGWLVEILAADPARLPALAAWAQRGALLGALAGGLGLWARAGFLLAACCGAFLLLLPCLLGQVVHNHHLIWFALLLAASPCDHALSLRWGVSGRPAASAAYGIPSRAAWVSIAAIFFFPGIWKLAAGGVEWVFSDNLRNHLYWKWAQAPDGFEPIRIDRVPGALRAAAVGVVGFELSFPLLIWTRRGRWLALVGALGFHAATAAIFDVRFSSLWLCYVVFVPWSAWVPIRQEAPGSSSSWPAAVVASGLIAGAIYAGATGRVQGWPFACYPTFQEIVGTEMPALVIVVVGPEGETELLPRDLEDGTWAVWAESWRLMGIGGPVDSRALEAFWARVSTRPGAEIAAGASEVRFYRGEVSVLPEDRGEGARRGRLLGVVR